MFSEFSKYGEAFRNLIAEVFNGNIIMEPVTTAFQYATKDTGNKLTFPFISFYPDNTMYLDKKNNAMPSYNTGVQFENPINIYNEDGSFKESNNRLAKNVEFLYIIIGYQLDVWGTNRLDTEQLMQELIFWLHINQQVETEYRGVKLTFTFELGDNIVDNTDLVSYQSNGKLYRYTYNIAIHAAIMRSENYFTVLHPNIKVEELKSKNMRGE